MTENAGAGGNGQGGSNGQPQFLTKADVEAMFGEFGKSIDQKIGGAVSGTLKKLDIGKAVSEAISAHEQAKLQANGGGGEGGGEGNGGAGTKVDPELVKIRRELDEHKKLVLKEREARVAAEQAGRKKSALADLRGALEGKVRPEVAATLTQAWQHEIAFDDDGNALMPLGDGTSTTIAAAVEQRVKSKDYEWARPAPNSGGAGTTASRANGANNFRGVNIAALTSKPRDKWTTEETDAYIAHRAAENSKAGGLNFGR